MTRLKKRILLIEDDGTLRQLYIDSFEQAGFKVEHAVEGNEGFAKLQEGGFDAALVDLLLPGIQGTQILERLQKNPPKVANGPIIILTNQDQQEVSTKCLKLGAAGVIIKSSITPDNLIGEVRNYLKES